MRAVVYAGDGQVRVDDVPEPKLKGSRDAIVKVTRAAICGSDLHILTGKTPGMPEGGVIGHEFVGEVTEVGDTVSNELVGARVVGSFLIACGECDFCAKGKFNFCSKRRALGFGPLTGDLAGSQTEYVRVPIANVNLRPLSGEHDGLTDEQALFAGDILTTGFYGAALSEIEPGDVVAVVGAGPVGLFCAGAAKSYSPKQVVLLDTDKKRVDFAQQVMGLDAIDVSETEPRDALTGVAGSLADVAIEAVGAPAALETAMNCVRDGGRITVIGVYGVDRYEMPMGICWVRGLDLRFAGMANVQGHWDQTLAAISNGDVDPTKIITHRLSLDDAVEGYELFRSREALKVVLQP
jgi:threonine dehydrogenase-like Zn-dependent dehydrogenase